METKRLLTADDYVFSLDSIDAFCEVLAAQGKILPTIQHYRRNLFSLLNFLPDDKILTRERIASWVDQRLEIGMSVNSINHSISTLNQYLKFVNRRDLQTEQLRTGEDLAQPELSRTEYLRLLQAAKISERERLYFLIKVFATVGLPLNKLELLTVEAVKQGFVFDPENNKSFFYIPDSLCTELEAYAERKGIIRGILFCTKEGNLPARTNIAKELKNLSKEARVDEKKAKVRCLIKLYRSTREKIESELEILAARNYNRLIEKEQSVYGWDS